jgi:hypothetical protein
MEEVNDNTIKMEKNENNNEDEGKASSCFVGSQWI